MDEVDLGTLERSELKRVAPDLPEWRILTHEGTPRLQRTLVCNGMSDAMWLTLKIGETAERLGRRVVILTESHRVTVALRTPGSAGVHRDDLAFAAELDAICGRH